MFLFIGNTIPVMDKLLKTVVKVAREDEYSGFLPQANDLSPDPDDVDFFALALKLNCSLWSEDKRWKQQSHVETLNTKELLERLGLISAQH